MKLEICLLFRRAVVLVHCIVVVHMDKFWIYSTRASCVRTRTYEDKLQAYCTFACI